MTDAAAHDLLERWLAGWTHLRRLDVERVDGVPLVHVASPSRATELVVVEPAPARLSALLAGVAGDPRAMLTVLGADPAALAALADVPPGVRLDRDDEVLMSLALDPGADRPAADPEGLSARWELDGARAHLSLEADGSVAAEGWAGVVRTDVVLDRVETSPRHRRRGLGRHVVRSLLGWAAAGGATTGLLAASADGRALYASLGWRDALPMRSWLGSEDGAPAT